MRKLLVAIVLAVFVLLTACAPKPKVITASFPPSEVVEEVKEEVAPPEADYQAALEAARAAADACLKPGVRVCQPVNLLTGSVGDSLIFPFGITNQFPQAKDFAITLAFVRVQQPFGAPAIEVDKETMAGWLAKNQLPSYRSLASQDKWLQPVIIEIGPEIAPGTATVPATYVFEIRANIYEDGFLELYGEPKQISVKVG